jgi:pyridoxamine 5'-phosphate oxidase
VFFTNLESRKATQIAENPHVSLLFPWLALERQVIVNGTAARVSIAEATEYFCPVRATVRSGPGFRHRAV